MKLRDALNQIQNLCPPTGVDRAVCVYREKYVILQTDSPIAIPLPEISIQVEISGHDSIVDVHGDEIMWLLKDVGDYTLCLVEDRVIQSHTTGSLTTYSRSLKYTAHLIPEAACSTPCHTCLYRGNSYLRCAVHPGQRPGDECPDWESRDPNMSP